MDSDELSGSSSRSVSPPSIRPRDHLQRTAGITTHEYLDDEYEDVSFDAVYNQPLTRTKEDDINLQYAAATARLPFDMMIDVEMEMFSDYVSDQVHVNTYLYIRNMILNLWNTNPSMELALENVFEEMPSAYRSLNYLIVKTFAFLERYGYINFGHFTTVEEMLKKNFSEKTNNSTARSAASLLSTRTKNNGYKIIVIGAGIAGLVAASQLKFLGFEVMVIEARNRIGGRIFTSETVNKLATDMGPSLVEGTNGNPLITLLKQTSAVHRRIDFDCSLYDDDGQLPFEYCELMAETFRRLSEAVILLSKENKVHEINGRPLSIQDTYDHFILLQEANVALQRREYYATIDELSDTLEKQSKALILTKDIMDTIATRLQEMYDSDPTPIREDFSLIETEAELQRVAAIKSLRYELSEACSIYDRLQVELTDIQHTMSTVRMKEPSEIYLTAMDRRMLDFYFANLELRLGTVLKNVSLSGFASIMTNHFGAKYYEVDGGISTLLKPLTKQLNIQHNQIVTAIEYDEKQQQVFVKHVKNPRSKEAKEQTRTEEDDEPQPLERVYRAHAVVCAVPLGCLKKRNVEQLHVDSKGIHPPDLKFHPPLPDRKRQVIDGMAVGSANKIVIEFQKRFWDSDFFFGKINDKECARGEFFLYTSAPNSRILTVHMAGAAANLNDSFSMQDLSNKVMQILGRIFGQDCPARPVQLITTRWHEDELSHGCFPYIPVNRSDEDYDVMAEPVLPPAANNSTRPYLFFAGDHTSREFPGRVHGAFLSGIREAARIANHFLGPINSSENRERFERLGRMFVINTPQQLHQSDSDD